MAVRSLLAGVRVFSAAGSVEDVARRERAFDAERRCLCRAFPTVC
jgi:hypothetical protein